MPETRRSLIGSVGRGSSGIRRAGRPVPANPRSRDHSGTWAIGLPTTALNTKAHKASRQAIGMS